jgi:predicted ferric reductase
MRAIKYAFWSLLALLSILWIAAEPQVFGSATFFALRGAMMQYSGILAMGCMSLAMILALRPRWPESWLGGLDKMYRLHKWLGIASLVIAVAHWLWAQGPRWAVGLGLLERPVRGARPAAASQIEQFFMNLHGNAEGIGEWAFYAVVVLIALALIRRFPYWLFYKTHRLIAVAYLVLVFHAAVLTKFTYWTTPIGIVMIALMACGTWAGIVVLLRRVGIDRQVIGRITSLQYYPGVRVLETEIDVPSGWPGHKAGQFAFATSDTSEGAHPYTIASAWHEADHRINFITKELGDHTSRLRENLRVGQEVTIEGPYGCFTFDDACPQQIWIGAGIGITPFIARMKNLARLRSENAGQAGSQTIDLFHPTMDYDEEAERKMRADAQAADVRLHFLVDARDGHLNGERIRASVARWPEASIWFCGPVGFGDALRRDFAEKGFPVSERFHQELFAMR